MIHVEWEIRGVHVKFMESRVIIHVVMKRKMIKTWNPAFLAISQ